jgi:hypothetical protein
VATRHRQGGFLLLRYEDMIADTADALAKIASFLGIAADANRLSRAIEKSSADRMRKLERSQAQQFSSTKNTRQDIPFVRAAQAGGWQSVLPRKLVEEIESAWGPLMQSLGYKLVTSPAPQADNLDSLSVLNSAART